MAAQSEQESEDQSSNTQVEQSPAAVEMPAPIAALDVNAEMKEKLIAAVKKEVKQLMEEAVTRKFVHEDSGGVTALCAAVEACLGQGLRRRALGLFKTSSTTALLHKIAKHCPEAANVSRRVLAAGAAGEGSGRSASGICTSSAPAPEAARSNSAPPPLSKRGSAGGLLAGVTSGPPQPPQPRYLWIRLALFERQLARIIAHLAANAPRYYERDSLVADPDCGSILASLLVGPCALDFSRAKTPAHYWSDPPADELVQRHRISAGTTTPPSCRRPILNFRRSLNASSDDGISMGNSNVTGGVASSGNTASVAHCAKDYVESLHQNSRATLLYGKNNVLVQPKDVPSPMAGYLSLHQAAPGLTIKWTPNQLMNGYAESETVDKSMCGRRLSCPVVVDTYHCKYSKVFYTVDENSSRRHSLGSQCINCLYWNYALNVSLDEVVYVHCHQGAGAEGAEEGGGGSVILVGQDGVQHPPIHFPKGGHLLAFLSCLETGLLPHGQLDPPLWSQRGQGKVFPRGNIGRRRPMPSVRESSGDSLESPAQTLEPSADYVFRIVSSHPHHQEFVNRHSLLERGSPRQSPLSPRPPRGALASASTTSSDSSTMSVDGHLSGQEGPTTPQMLPATQVTQVASIALVCSTMRRQIISRAFYGWLAYCRHLSTVRTHLSGLVHPTIIPKEGAEGGLTEERWRQLTDEEGAVTDFEEVQRLTYYGGVQHEIRKEVWPYLLGYYDYGSTTASRLEQDATCRRVYETTMSEWLCVEAIVRQRDREAQAASIAKLSEGSGGSAHANGANGDANLNNEVFEDNCSILSDDPPVISPEMSDYDQTPKKNRQNRIIASNLASLDDAEPIADDAVRKASQTEEISEDTNDRPNESIEPGESDGIREDPTNNEKHNENTNTGETHVKNIEVTDNNKKSSEEADENLAEDTNGVIKTSETDKKDTEIIDENNTSLVELDVDDTHDTLDENETLSLRNTIVNPDLRRESEVEIRRLAECIVQRGDGRGPQCSVDSANLNGNDNEFAEVVSFGQKHTSVIVTNPSVDLAPNGSPVNGTVNASPSKSPLGVLREESASGGASVDTLDPPGGATLDPAGENITNKEGVRSNCASPASSNGGIYSTELLENFALNLHRIEKDVQRCDRNYWFFTMDNLDKLRNIMCTYVWEHLDEGYMQGMCDLVAPLLVILGDEAVAHACFTRLMQRALHNFPCGQAMDAHFANMRSLIQILDCEMYELMHAHNDYTHFYFCYRWFLLDFKRELLYKDVFYAWELIWSARDTASEHMVLFVALALLETYRDIILSNSMDFTDIIKFFNEMAEHHDAMAIFSTARELVLQVQTLIENK